jgi:hypothetical protein
MGAAASFVIKVASDGRVSRERFDATDSIGQLQRAVGGCIERVPAHIRAGVYLFMNDEGLLHDLPGNGVLTRFVYHHTGKWFVLVGDAVIAAHGEDGETAGLPEGLCGEFEASLARCGGKKDGNH